MNGKWIGNIVHRNLPLIVGLMVLIVLLPLNSIAQTRLETPGSVNSVAFSSDGGTLGTLASGGFDIQLWNPHTGELLRTIEVWHLVTSIAFSPDGRTLASGTAGHTVQLWNVETGEHIRTLEGHTDWVNSVAFSPDGRTLASASGFDRGDYTVRLWNVQTGEHIRTLEEHTAGVNSVVFSPDGSTLASGGNDAIRLWNARTGEHIRAIEVSYTQSVAYSPDGDTLASGGIDAVIDLWDVNTGTHLREIEGHDNSVFGVAYSPDGNTLASGSWDTTVRLWNADTGELIQTFEGHSDWVISVAYSPDGNTLASGSDDETVRLWHLTSPQLSVVPSPVESPQVGRHLAINVNIADTTNVAGYELIVDFDGTALAYVGIADGNYLPESAFAVPPVEAENRVTLAATSLESAVSGDGTLATVTFEGIAATSSELRFTVTLVNPVGERIANLEHSVELAAPSGLPEDANGDGVVNILDLVLVAEHMGEMGENIADLNSDGVVNILDLILVAAAIGGNAAAPSALPQTVAMLSTTDIQAWLADAHRLALTDSTSMRGVQFLEHLLMILAPHETVLLSNYPNPFNPETWIPYQLTHDAHVKLTIYDANGALVRLLDVGHQSVGIYQSRARAAYWDGKNHVGEAVASGLYFYTLTAGEFTATRKMLIRK